MTDEFIRSGIGHSTPDAITVCGRDLADELMGRVSFTDLAFMLVARRAPTAGEARLFDAVLVSLTDHGLTPTVLAARLTHTGAPESIQAAVAAGLLGAGSVFLGPTGDTAQFLADVVARARLDRDSGDEALQRGRRGRRCARCATAAAACPGSATRSTRRSIRACRACTRSRPRPACSGRTCGCSRRCARRTRSSRAGGCRSTAPARPARRSPTSGCRPDVARGFALLARTAGLVGHLAEEARQPLGMPLYREIDRRMVYEPGDDAR